MDPPAAFSLGHALLAGFCRDERYTVPRVVGGFSLCQSGTLIAVDAFRDPGIPLMVRAQTGVQQSARRSGGLLLAGLLTLLFAGCSATPLNPVPPTGYAVTGNWELLPDQSDAPPAPLALRARGGMLGLVAQDFAVLRARRMTIEQDHDSMGISYDGGEYRDVSWGDRKRGLWEVRAGWLDGQLVIISKASDADARETLSLSADGQVLTVRVELRSGGESLALRRTFARR